MASWTTSTKAATSWSVTRSRSLTAATSSGVTLGARARTAAAAARGMVPTSAHPSTASSSTSSHISRRASSVNSAAISGSE